MRRPALDRPVAGRPTVLRQFGFPDHRPPSGRHARGRVTGVWHGTSRVLDPGGRRRANRKSWKRLLDVARREVVAASGSGSA